MKVKMRLFLMIFLLMSFLIMAFAPMITVRGQEGEPQLTEVQLFVIGVVASALTWVLKIIAGKGWQLKKEHLAIGLYVVSFVVAIAFTSLTLPSFPQFSDAPSFVAALLKYILLLIELASPVVGMAYLIYNLLLKRVLEQMFRAVVKG